MTRHVVALFCIVVSCRASAAEPTCGTFFGGAAIMNDMVARALSTEQRTFEDVVSTEISDFEYKALSSESCNFTFQYTETVKFKFKSLPGCTSIFRVKENVLHPANGVGMPGNFIVNDFNVDHGFDDVDCSDLESGLPTH